MGRAPCTKETLPDFLKWRQVTRPPLVFRRLTGSQRTPGFWGVTTTTLARAYAMRAREDQDAPEVIAGNFTLYNIEMHALINPGSTH